jgi:hypothetical protein
VATLLAATAPGVAGSQVVPRPGASSLRAVVFPSALSQSMASVVTDTVPPRYRPTYWQEGALLGAFVIGLGAAALAGGLCADNDSGSRGPCWDNVLLGTLIGIGSGGTVGALAGGLIQKPERSPADTTKAR